MDVVVVGGGASGMMSAIMAARASHKVVLVEKNEKLGKKIFITGKGRCNITNACDIEDLFSNVISNSKFMYSPFYSYSNDWVMDFFEKLNLPLKIERGNRVFPVSDHSSDVIRVLKNELNNLGVDVIYNSTVKSVKLTDGCVNGVELKNGKIISCDAVVLAMGGKSYSSTGSTGDGYRIAKDLDLNLVEPEPSLVPLVVKEDYISQLQGLSLKNVGVRISVNNKVKYDNRGEMLFTHFGVSGPLILSASCYIKEKDYDNEPKLIIDLKPALSEKQLDERIVRDFDEQKNKQFRNSLSKLLPSKLVPIVISLADIDPYKKVNEITKDERLRLVNIIKNLEFTVVGNRGFNEAIITRGGVSVKEVDPSTLKVKKYEGLYIVGEMLDLDALTGGFNLQIAWSTGALAGSSIS